ncbi:MAG: DUF885 family protein [Phycisphaerales bacterium]
MKRFFAISVIFAAAAHAQPGAMPDLIRRFEADEGALSRKYSVEFSRDRRTRLEGLHAEQLAELESLEWSSLGVSERIDAVLMRNEIRRREARTRRAWERFDAATTYVPFQELVIDLARARREGTRANAEGNAGALAAMKSRVERSKAKFLADLKPEGGGPGLTPTQCRQIQNLIEGVKWHLGEWYRFSAGYDPVFSWWCDEPYKAANKALEDYARVVKEQGVGVTDATPDVIVGTPIGRDGLVEELGFEFIPYTPEELLAIGEREHQWCLDEMKKAAGEMGLGDDWRAALERVKTMHVAPGEQPTLIRELALDAVTFLQERDLLTIPSLARETWRVEMMSPAAQKVSPFFLGGEEIIISFPTDGMSHEQKMMSMRGNNRHFSRATVHHELIPGHHLQQFMNSRHMQHREPFSTPFWTEGWALYWETRMWDLGYAKSPENKMGMLFWRNHRCARIVFSLKYHLGEMSPQQCIDYLVDEAGHERANAEGEVRRSVAGGYGPLYQVAYMMGGLQFRALHKELVQSGKMTEKQFHDAVLREGNMPIELVRAALTGQKLERDHAPSWKFDQPR